KKVVVTALSTVFLASMATSAFAAVKDGFYYGGDAKRYYSFETMMNLSDADLDKMLSETSHLLNEQIVYVHEDGNAVTLKDALAKPSAPLEDLLNPATEELFEEGDYTEYDANNQPGNTYNPRENVDKDPGEPGDIAIENVNPISLNKIK